MAQLVKKPPAIQETWVRSLSLEDPLEKGKATDSSILAEFHGLYIAWGRKELGTTDFTSLPGSCSHLACCSLQPCPGREETADNSFLENSTLTAGEGAGGTQRGS